MARQYWEKALSFIGFSALVFAHPGLAATPPNEDPAAIRAAVEAAVRPHLEAVHGANVEIDVDPIDARLQLPECGALSVTLPTTDAATIAAKVSCETPGWTVYVPVHLHAWVDAVVAAGNLVPNRALGPQDLARARVDIFSGRPGIMTDPRQVEGKILRAGLSVGTPILATILDLPISVHRGQKVVMTLKDPTMTIKATAVALEDGRVGDNIAVQNAESQKTLRATVAKDGGVELNF